MPQKLSFDEWKSCLRDDCVKDGKLLAFDTLGDYVLKILWDAELEPTVKAITSDGKAFGESAADD
jgi:hypothetical protein